MFELLLTPMTFFLEGSAGAGEDTLNIFGGAANWIIKQARWIIIAAIVVLALQAWFQGKTMAVFGTIVVGIIIMMFATTDDSLLDSISDSIKTILNLDK